jgi:predicted nucleic acid-binding Zn ribbon protein
VVTYSYECECGEIANRVCEMGKAPKGVKCTCGKRAPRKWGQVNAICRYSYMERSAGNPRVNRGKGRR